MPNRYLNESGARALIRLSRQGIFPSPYNFINHNGSSSRGCIIHECTLREGEQTPGVVFSVEDKVRIAAKLDEVGVQEIEAGFPVVSEKQRKGIEALMKMGLDAKINCFSRARQGDVDAVVETGADGVVVSLSISQHHRKHKFHGMSKEKYLSELAKWVSYAKDHGLFVVFGAEDSTRENDLDFLKSAFRTAEEAGADRARIVDTLGCILPSGISFLVGEIRKVMAIPLEVHCHNDLGLALANSLAAVEAGATAISTSVNGIGERSGIAPTEEAIPALHVLFGINQFNIRKLTDLSRLVEEITGLQIAVNKPITGKNAYTHGSGIHQHGIFMNPVTYEFYPPERLGRRRTVIIDELCGTHGILYIAEKELGIEISETVAKDVASRIKLSYKNGRRSAYPPDELKKLIVLAKWSARAAEVD